MPIASKIRLAFSAARELGLKPLWYMARYQVGLHSGWTARQVKLACDQAEIQSKGVTPRTDFATPARKEILPYLEANRFAILAEAEEISSGKVRLFGGPPTDLRLSPSDSSYSWQDYETGRQPYGVQDPKDIWEPARFGLVFPLTRAYLLTGEHKWALEFWEYYNDFWFRNFPDLGLNWCSGQEVALRIIAFCFAVSVFGNESTDDDQLHAIAHAIAGEAARIPPTLDYARAQGNNHLLSEAAGLYTAGVFLPDHPAAPVWRRLGWSTFHKALQDQISPDGTYIQHSLNYHRLMLDLALWMHFISRSQGDPFPPASLDRLGQSVRWFFAKIDLSSGQAPNLGSNDGARLFPLTSCGFSDMRPTLQAASRAFLGVFTLPAGPWDELSAWLGLPSLQAGDGSLPSNYSHKLVDGKSWAMMRVVQFRSRPNHADQLHVDLWSNGQPITLDAGTYRYSAPPRWNNSLAGTLCHNTLSVDGLDQMRRAGKFLWLDWADSYSIDSADSPSISAWTNAYRKLDLKHTRTLANPSPGRWQVVDEVESISTHQSGHTYILHWLIADVAFELEGNQFRLNFPGFTVKVSISAAPGVDLQIQLIRAGELLSGTGDFPPFLGWYSPTYSVKQPALSLRMITRGLPPTRIISDWVITST